MANVSIGVALAVTALGLSILIITHIIALISRTAQIIARRSFHLEITQHRTLGQGLRQGTTTEPTGLGLNQLRVQDQLRVQLRIGIDVLWTKMKRQRSKPMVSRNFNTLDGKIMVAVS